MNVHETPRLSVRLLAKTVARSARPLLALLVATGLVQAQTKSLVISNTTWGTVTAPVYGSSESNANYSAAETLAGPNKFGSYFAGVLPNGRKVTPSGTSVQIGMNPLGVVLTPDGKFAITSNDDERDANYASYQSSVNKGGYSLTVVNTSTMAVVSQYNVTGVWFIGMQATGTGPYTIWVSGGGDNNMKTFTLDGTTGILTAGASIAIPATQPSTSGFVSNYTPNASWNVKDVNGNLPTAPSGFNRTANPAITFPAGSALSPDGKYLYVACNGDNSVAVINTTTQAVAKQVSVGRFPYAVSVSNDGTQVYVSNWGVEEYKFKSPIYGADGTLTALATTGANYPDGFYVPNYSATGTLPASSSVTVLSAPGGDGSQLTPVVGRYFGRNLDSLNNVGSSHPNSMAVVKAGTKEVLYVAQGNTDKLGRIQLRTNQKLTDIDLSVVSGVTPLTPHGTYPNALVVSPDNKRLYVAEAGINSIAVLDVTDPTNPSLLGRIPSGWYPTAVSISADSHYLYVANAKGIGEDINPAINTAGGTPPPTGLGSDSRVDSNFIFGSLQQIDLTTLALDNTTVLNNNYAVNTPSNTDVVPLGGKPSARIKHVIFILHENKTFDAQLGSLSANFGNFAGTNFNNIDGTIYSNIQNTGVTLNTQALATTFATAVNYYSESEESDAGHQFAASGTATDYTEKTLLVKGKRGMLVNKNFEPEDYPETGYIFNNAARHKVSFKDYGAMVRIEGTDTGSSTPTTLNDPLSGNAGYPQLQADGLHITDPLVEGGDTTTTTTGLGQSYFLAKPVVAILGGTNANGEARLDLNYPGYNFNISDQRRALEFIADFDRMANAGTLPTFLYIYQPNDHTGSVQAPNTGVSGKSSLNQIADGDVGLGMVVNHIMNSSVYYDATSNTGSAIFATYDDAQSSLDHVHPHRTPLVVISPFAKPGFLATRHYSTASIVKTEELLMGLPPNNLGDLFATDLRDMFQSTYNGIVASQVGFKIGGNALKVQVSPEAEQIWALAKHLDLSGPDRDSKRLGYLHRLELQADQLHSAAKKAGTLATPEYAKQQKALLDQAIAVVHTN